MGKLRLTVAALAVAGLSAAGVGTAFAAPPGASPSTAVAPAAGAAGNVQQGNQNAPDTATAGEKAGAEAAGQSDGPGGHQDPAAAWTTSRRATTRTHKPGSGSGNRKPLPLPPCRGHCRMRRPHPAGRRPVLGQRGRSGLFPAFSQVPYSATPGQRADRWGYQTREKP